MAKLLRRENISPTANGLSQKVGWNKMDAPGAKPPFSEQLVMQDQQQNLNQVLVRTAFIGNQKAAQCSSSGCNK